MLHILWLIIKWILIFSGDPRRTDLADPSAASVLSCAAIKEKLRKNGVQELKRWKLRGGQLAVSRNCQ